MTIGKKTVCLAVLALVALAVGYCLGWQLSDNGEPANSAREQLDRAREQQSRAVADIDRAAAGIDASKRNVGEAIRDAERIAGAVDRSLAGNSECAEIARDSQRRIGECKSILEEVRKLGAAG